MIDVNGNICCDGMTDWQFQMNVLLTRNDEADRVTEYKSYEEIQKYLMERKEDLRKNLDAMLNEELVPAESSTNDEIEEIFCGGITDWQFRMASLLTRFEELARVTEYKSYEEIQKYLMERKKGLRKRLDTMSNEEFMHRVSSTNGENEELCCDGMTDWQFQTAFLLMRYEEADSVLGYKDYEEIRKHLMEYKEDLRKNLDAMLNEELVPGESSTNDDSEEIFCRGITDWQFRMTSLLTCYEEMDRAAEYKSYEEIQKHIKERKEYLRKKLDAFLHV